jgi:hypothetical protein
VPYIKGVLHSGGLVFRVSSFKGALYKGALH